MQSLFTSSTPRHLDYIYAEGRVVALHVKNGNADSLYDPVIGRFFSPDPFVQAPDFTQGFNRYSYCMNNPVMCSDPDGEFFWALVIISAMVGAFFGGVRADQKGEIFLGGMVKGAFIGGFGGVLTTNNRAIFHLIL